MRIRVSAAMTAAILLLAASVWMVPPAAAETTVGRRYALLIGVSMTLGRGVTRLNFVDNDIEELARMLKRQGFEVRTVLNDRADRRRILEELYSHALTLTDKDTFVLYYAGHGVRNVEVNRKTYWLTYDADLRMLDVHGIRLEHLLSYVDDIRASRKVILLDHCYSGDVEGLRLVSHDFAPAPAAPAGAAPPDGPAGARLSRHASLVGDFQAELSIPRTEGTLLFPAARGEAFELQTLGHGVFTKALLDACSSAQWDNKDYKRSVLELTEFVGEQVKELLKQAGAPPQIVQPIVGGSPGVLGLYFCILPVPKNEVAGKAAEYGEALQAWETKGLLGPDELGQQRRAACTVVLDKWKGVEGDQSVLDDREHRILAAIRLFADVNDMTPEQVRADKLLDALKREGH